MYNKNYTYIKHITLYTYIMKFKNPLIVATILALSLTSTSVSADHTTTHDASEKKAHILKMKDGKSGEAKKAMKGNRGERVKGYKKAFSEKLKNNLDSISTEKLESVHGRIITIIEKVEANTSMNAEKQEALLAQLVALQELIEEQIESK